MSTPSSPLALASPGLIGGLALRLGVAGAVFTAAAAGVGWALAPEAGSAALLAGGVTLLGVGLGLAITALALGFRTVEPAFAVLAGSVGRLLLGLALAYGVEAVVGPANRPYWLSFLMVMAGVLVAETAAAARLLNAPKETGSA